MKMLAYLKSRLGERGTWVAVGAAVTGAAALGVPWSYIFVAVGIVGALVPTP